MNNDGTKDDQFDDVDFDDLDDDLDGEDWDDFDDDPVEDGDVSLDDETDSPGAPLPPKDKTFLQKNFNFIIVGVALLGGAALILPMLTGGSEVTDPTAEIGMMDDTTQADGSGGNELPMLETETDMELAGSQDSAATPMNTQDDDLFADLDADLSGANDEGDLLSGDGDLTLEDDVLTPLPETDDTDVVLSSLDEELNEADSALPDLNFEDDSGDDILAADDSVSSDDLMQDEPLATDSADMDVAVDDFADTDAPLLEDDSLDLPMEDSQGTDITSENSMDADILKEKDALIEQLREENENIEMLNANMRTEIAALKEENETLKAAKNEPAKSSEAPQAPVKQQEAVKSKAPAEVVKAPAAAPKQVRKIEWVLKAAQPGRATISSKNSSDIRQIEVGDTVSGVGKITSIGLENGKWLVRGTLGRISQ